MRVSIRNVLKKEDEQVIIDCVEITKTVRDIESYVRYRETEISGILQEQKMKRFLLSDVYYFEALDEKVFAYTKEQVYEIKMRLYEVEENYATQHFIRCSKSVVMNLMRLESISPAMNGRFFAHMQNGEKLMISRQYAPKLKELVMGGN